MSTTSSLAYRARRLAAGIPLRLAAYAILPIVIVAVAAGALFLRELEDSLERHLQQEIAMVARSLRLPVSDALVDGRFDRLERSLESAGEIGRVYGASVYDARGNLVTALGGAASSDRHRASRIMADGERVGKYSTVEGREVYAYFVPLSGPGERVTGLLEVTRKRRDIDLLMTESRQQALVLLGIAVAVIAVVVILGHHAAVGRSLRAVEDTIRDADSGDMLQRAPVGGPREVVAVAEALNAMLDSLHHAEVCVARERGSRARLEEELRRSETLAAIGRLAAGIAHELGSPLTLADGHAQRVLRVRDLRGRVRDEVVRLRHEIGRMARIVRMLLDYGRGGGREMRSIDVHRLLTVCSTAVRASASEREVALDIDVPTTVSKMVGNESRIEQAVVNLLRNAVEAAHAQVHVEVRTRGGCLELTIDDDGSGVPPSVAQTLFEPFVTTKGSQGGTGLGLAIASSAAQEHGGALTVSTGPLGGARFVLSLRRDRRVAAHERGAS